MTVEAAAKTFKESRDSKSFEILYMFIQKVTGIIGRKWQVGYNEDIELIVAEKVYKKIDQFDPVKAPFYNWLYTIILNEYRHAYRDVKRDWNTVGISDAEEDFEIGKRQNVILSYTPEYEFENESYIEAKVVDEIHLTVDDIYSAIDTFIKSFEGQTAVSNAICSKLDAVNIYKRVIFDDCPYQVVADEFGISLGNTKNIVLRYRTYFVRYLKKLYPDKIFPEMYFKAYKRGNDN
jgi:RNA polymerase sigma factor (sigma-70 family)